MKTLIVNPWHWLTADGELPDEPRLRKQTLRVARIIEYGSELELGESREMLVECRNRIAKKPCPGLLWVIREGANLVAFCPVCRETDTIVHDWEDTIFANGMMPPVPPELVNMATPKTRAATGPKAVVNAECFDVVVTLLDVEPKTWRRFLLAQRATFADLHTAIQQACGWENSHLFAFRSVDDEAAAIAGSPGMEDEETPNAASVNVASCVTEDGAAFHYEYDFGDGWLHEVLLKPSAGIGGLGRKLLDGARAFPPEDSGGIPGYDRCVDFRRTGKDPWGDDDQDLKKWLRGWHPESFDLAVARKKFDR